MPIRNDLTYERRETVSECVTGEAWECPPPRAGERPVIISEAARITGHSRSAISARTLDGRLPYRVPIGQTRPKKVFPSQVLAVFGEEEAS